MCDTQVDRLFAVGAGSAASVAGHDNGLRPKIKEVNLNSPLLHRCNAVHPCCNAIYLRCNAVYPCCNAIYLHHNSAHLHCNSIHLRCMFINLCCTFIHPRYNLVHLHCNVTYPYCNGFYKRRNVGAGGRRMVQMQNNMICLAARSPKGGGRALAVDGLLTDPPDLLIYGRNWSGRETVQSVGEGCCVLRWGFVLVALGRAGGEARFNVLRLPSTPPPRPYISPLLLRPSAPLPPIPPSHRYTSPLLPCPPAPPRSPPP